MTIRRHQQGRLSLEERIHSLLCGELTGVWRDRLVSRLARDANARRLLREMVDLQQRAREAFRYDKATKIMRQSLADLLKSLRKR